MFTSNKLSTRLAVLLAQIKAGNNSKKLKKPGKYCIFCINTKNHQKKSLQQLNQLIIIIEEYMIAIRYPKTCYFILNTIEMLMRT